MLSEALAYVDRGWPVFPLGEKGKKPKIPTAHPEGDPLRGCMGGCGRLGHGLYDATIEPRQVHDWWAKWPAANIGLRCGVAFDVLDVDARDPWEATANAWPAVDMPGGPVASTGKGWHFYLAPSGLGNATLIGGASCDFRGAGGYVVAPPSLHPSGRRYEWYAPVDLGLMPAPEALLTLLDPPREKRTPPPAPPPGDTSLRGGWTPRGLVQRLATAAAPDAAGNNGERNHVLNWAAYKVGLDVSAGKATSEQARDALGQLYDTAISIGLAEREIEATIRSGYSTGARGVVA